MVQHVDGKNGVENRIPSDLENVYPTMWEGLWDKLMKEKKRDNNTALQNTMVYLALDKVVQNGFASLE